MRVLCNFVLLLCSVVVLAEQPDWCSNSFRAVNFPKEQYFTGVVYGEVNKNESVSAAIERIKNLARIEAISTISVSVQNETDSHVYDKSFESLEEWTEEISETLDSRTHSRVDLGNIPGIQIEAWKNPNSNEVVAFAYIKKNTLCRQMDKQLIVSLTCVENILENVESLSNGGQKLQARETLLKAIPLFQQVEQAQRILLAVAPYNDVESLQLNELKQLVQRYILLSTQLQNGISIYLSCDTLYNQTVRVDVANSLSSIGYNLVDSASLADWSIYINTKISNVKTNTQGDQSEYFINTECTIVIDNMAASKRIFMGSTSERGQSYISRQEAFRRAIIKLAPKISEIIKNQIEQ